MNVLRTTLLAGAAVAALAASAQAQLAPATAAQRFWYQDARFIVWQDKLPSGAPVCQLKAFQPTATGNATWGISLVPGSPAAFVYSEDGMAWNNVGNVTLQRPSRAL
jgi:hypothetical protein